MMDCRNVVALVVISIFLQFGTSAVACTCGAGTFEQNLRNAEFVFVGTVEKVEPFGSFVNPFLATNRIQFSKIESIKGDPKQTPLIEIFTGAFSESCGTPFQPMETYLVFASGSPLTTNTCFGTDVASNFSSQLARLRSNLASNAVPLRHIGFLALIALLVCFLAMRRLH
jgi:hypothetical protein